MGGGTEKRRWLAYLLIVLACLFWGGNAVAGRMAVGEVSPMLLTFVRWTLVMLCLAAALGRNRQLRRDLAELRDWRGRIILFGIIGLSGFNALFYVAARWTSALNIAIIQGGVPAAVLIGAALFQKTRVGLLQIVGAAVTIVGVLVVASQGSLAHLAAIGINLGDAIMLLLCVLQAFYTLSLRTKPKVSATTYFTALAFVAFIFSVPLVVAEAALGLIVLPHSLTGYGVLLYVGIFPSLLAQIFLIRSVELIGPSRTSIFSNLVPVFGAGLAVLVLGESFGIHHAIGLLAVLAGIFIAERWAARPA